MSQVIHSWWARQNGTLCGIMGYKAGILVKYTSMAVNCPKCLSVLAMHGFDEHKHVLDLEEFSNTEEELLIEETIITSEIVSETKIEEKEEEDMIGYCVKCKAKTEMGQVEYVTMKNGKPASKGICTVCGTKMYKIGKAGLIEKAKEAVDGD